MTATATCQYCHPHCVRCDHSSDCITCDCRKTLPIRRRPMKIILGHKYLLRQGRVCKRRRVVSGEIVTVVSLLNDDTYVALAHDGERVEGIKPNELGRYKG